MRPTLFALMGFIFLTDGTPTQSAQQNPSNTFKDCNNCPEMVIVPAGKGFIGLHESQEGHRNELPWQEIIIDRPFAVGKFELTYGEYQSCVEAGGCEQLKQHRRFRIPQMPATYMRWEDAVSYVNWLSEKSGKPYRLLTEKEWEYVARAGQQTAYSWGDQFDPAKVVCKGCSQEKGVFAGQTRSDNKVVEFSIDRSQYSTPQWGEKVVPPNRFGVYHVLGNIREWVDGCFLDVNKRRNSDVTGTAEDQRCAYYILKGVMYTGTPQYIRVSRFVLSKRGREIQLPYGTRVALSIENDIIKEVK